MTLKTYCVPGTHSPPLIPSLGVSLPSGDTIVIIKARPLPDCNSLREKVRAGSPENGPCHKKQFTMVSKEKLTLEEGLKGKKHRLPAYREQGRRRAPTPGCNKGHTGLERNLLWGENRQGVCFSALFFGWSKHDGSAQAIFPDNNIPCYN